MERGSDFGVSCAVVQIPGNSGTALQDQKMNERIQKYEQNKSRTSNIETLNESFEG